MKKRLKLSLSFFLVFTILLSSLCIPASSFENDIDTSTNDVLLINLDTDTVVYSQKPDNMWYSGYLAVLMTYLIAYENISDPENVTFDVDEDFIDELPYSDGCLDVYIGETLTAEDLMAVTLLTSGSDSAYALAYLVSGSDLSGFVKLMNDRAKKLGCSKTNYVSPGYSDESKQHTTCRDVCKLYKQLKKTDLFKSVMKKKEYTPDGLDEDDYTVTPEASMLNDDSPYYFKYTNDAKFSYTEDTYANLVITTTYSNMTYLYVGLLGLNESERNVYADARKLVTWAYLNLSDHKVISADEDLADVTAATGWGSYSVSLYPSGEVYKTLPNDFEEENIYYEAELPENITLPIKKGQKIAVMSIEYDSETIDKVDLIVNSDEGLDMLSDSARFATYVFYQLMGDEYVDGDAGSVSE